MKLWLWYLLVIIIITLSDATDANEEKSEHLISLPMDEEQIIPSVKESTNELSGQRFPNIYDELSKTSARTDMTEISAIKTSNDSNSVVTQSSYGMEKNSAYVNSISTVKTKNKPKTDKDISQLAIVTGVVSVILMVILVAVASTAVMKRKKRQTDEISLSCQYAPLLD